MLSSICKFGEYTKKKKKKKMCWLCFHPVRTAFIPCRWKLRDDHFYVWKCITHISCKLYFDRKKNDLHSCKRGAEHTLNKTFESTFGDDFWNMWRSMQQANNVMPQMNVYCHWINQQESKMLQNNERFHFGFIFSLFAGGQYDWTFRGPLWHLFLIRIVVN